MGIFDLFRKKPAKDKPAENKPAEDNKDDKKGSLKDAFPQILEHARREMTEKKDHHYSITPGEYKSYAELLALPDKQKLAFILGAIRTIDANAQNRGLAGSENARQQNSAICDIFMTQLLRTKLNMEESDLLQLYTAFVESRKYAHASIMHWPLSFFVIQVERNTKGVTLTEGILSMLKKLKDALTGLKEHYYEKDKVKLIGRLDALIFQSTNKTEAVRSVYFPSNDEFAKHANGTLKAIQGKEQEYWFQLMALAQKSTGGKPTKKFLTAGKEIIDRMGPDHFKNLMIDWFTFIIKLTESREEHTHTYQGGRTYTWATYEFLNQVNTDFLKGFVWLCSHLNDSILLQTTAALAERCYKKIPGKGPAAPAIGNACFYSLANSNGLEGVGHLSRLKLKVKQSNTEALIDKYLQEAAKDHGVTVHEVEDMAVDDFDLVDGKREYRFDDYTAVLEITGIGRTELSWYRPDGKPQKSVPATVKEKYAAELKELKNTAKQIETNLTSQRDRIDRLFKAKRQLSAEKFNEHYFSHGLLSYIARRLIWNIDTGGTTITGFYLEGQWVNARNEPVTVTFDENVTFSLWHPVQGDVDEVRAWREFFLDKNIAQPLKQAFREVYLLTDAEINTRTYSNRMAAHILKQHQFNSLAKTRGWKYSLLGAYDDGRDNEIASIKLPDYGLRAEYWVNEVNADNAMNDTGIWLYIATDQVRFVKMDSEEIVELINIPPMALSEVMRDVDLFVGVASVGNDPAWRDNGGLPAYRDYWQGYSFGELTEVAKTRKQILQRLLPRLKISKVAEIKDRFLIVQGKLRTYKIHLGSTNILMEPNDQYLCIVPDRSQKSGNEQVFLPFEGDNGLSVIISKAFLLAEDDKITDTTITRQISIK